jgi:hypothetical protein
MNNLVSVLVPCSSFYVLFSNLNISQGAVAFSPAPDLRRSAICDSKGTDPEKVFNAFYLPLKPPND